MNGLRRAGWLAALALLALAPTATAAIPAPPSQWYKLPGLNAASGAQWVRAFAYSTPPNVVYAGLEGGGVFKSENGGATWSEFNSGFPNPLITNVRALLASSTGTTVYAGMDTGIYKSTGGAWQPVAQGPEEDPASPKKLNESVQSLISLTGGSTMLAGVFSGGVFKSTDGGETWSPPPANSGMPVYESVYSLTENVPGFVYATGHSGVYLSTDQGSTWTRWSDGIPGGASPITTWAFPPTSGMPQMLFTSTGSNGIYRSLNGGITWAENNNGLNAVRARGFVILPGSFNQGAHLFAATENALWEGTQGGGVNPPDINWHQVTQDGLIEPGQSNLIMWALTEPVIPGAGGLGLIAGTQSNGGYFLSFEPVDSDCPTGSHNNQTTTCPQLQSYTAQVGKTLTIQDGFITRRGAWTGTGIIEYAYQWERCTSPNSGCSPIADAEEVSYTVPKGDVGYSYRIKVTATNPAPSFDQVFRYSAPSTESTDSPSNAPGYNQICPPSIVVLSPGETTSPTVGDTMYAPDGGCASTTDPNNGWFNPAATAVSFRWLRCENSGANCNEISGATGRSYVLTAADGNRTLRVRITGSASGFSTPITTGDSYYVISSPAAIADPIPNPDGGDPLSQAPSLQGEAYVGETLVGNVGGWKDPTTDFLKRWVRCDADGNFCSSPIYKVATTDPEDGSTYTVRAEDIGYTLKLEVEADVNFDLTQEPPEGGDGLDNHLPHSVFAYTPASAVVGYRPVPPPPAPPGGTPGPGTGPGAGPDTTAPAIQAATLTKSSFVAGKGTTFQLRISEPATVRIRISRATTGRKVGKKCVKTTRKNRKRKKCKYQKTLTTIKRPLQPAGNVAIKFSGKIGKRKLRPGTYLATIIVTDAAGNVATKRLVFKIKRR